jgi:hypothetical protein
MNRANVHHLPLLYFCKAISLTHLPFEAYIPIPNRYIFTKLKIPLSDRYIKINMPVQHWGKTLGMNGSNISNIEVVECHENKTQNCQDV